MAVFQTKRAFPLQGLKDFRRRRDDLRHAGFFLAQLSGQHVERFRARMCVHGRSGQLASISVAAVLTPIVLPVRMFRG
jgi:hypothetical protein